MPKATYKIIRFHFNDDLDNNVIKRGLTLDEAQSWCSDPETSSSTCVEPKGVNYTKMHGKWFDGYEEE